MEQIELHVSDRKLLGKRVRHLRKQGWLPANVFGHGVASQSLQVETKAFQAAFARAGTNTLVVLKFEGAVEPRMALIRGVQRNPVSRQTLHADFYQVSMTEKIRLSVPLVFVGAAPAVAAQGGILLRGLDKVEIECLPADLVHSIQVDVTGLAEIGASLYVKDLKVGEAITIRSDAEALVAKVAPPAKAEAEAVTEAAPAEVEVVSKKETEEEEAG